ncbi:MAG TPA: tetratricopeptide repeat protein, partial [Candidatus Omnitrophica bacterium]|nr:tetratricopeptide repeat protein [Candidatus Omnitrophota bacterium]
VYYQLEDFDKALEFIEKAYNKEPNDPVILDHLGDVYYKKRMLDKALEKWQKSLAADPDREDLAGKIEGAREEIEQQKN